MGVVDIDVDVERLIDWIWMDLNGVCLTGGMDRLNE